MVDRQQPGVYLVRHAQSANNAQADEFRVCDPGITEIGRKQAAAAAEFFRDLEFQTLVTSGFRRALQTAAFLSTVTGTCPEVVVGMHEHGGCFDGWNESNYAGRPGMTAEEISAEFGPVRLPQDFPPGGWWQSRPRESHPQSDQRARAMSEWLGQRISQADSSIVCVTHADFLSKLLLSMLGDPIRKEPGFCDLKNCGWTHLVWSSSGWRLVQLNQTDYLPNELRTS